MIDDKEALKSLNKLEKQSNSNKKAFNDVTKSILAVGAAALTAAAAIGGKALHSAVEFEKQMANVGTLLDGDVKSKMVSLGENVKNISKEMGISTEVLTDGLYNVISAFGETEESMKILEVASKGAAAGNATVTDAVNLLSAVTKGYGDTSVEAANKASDLAFLAVKLGQTTFPELASAMGKVIPLASTMKVSQEELFGAMATLTGVTGGTAEVTTQLRSTLQAFLQPSKGMTEALKKMGYANGQAALESEGLGGILNKLKDSVGGNEIALSGFFSSVEAKNAVLALTGAQADNFRIKTDAMHKSVGATTEAFNIQQDTIGVTFDKFRAKADVMLIDIGEKLLPVLSNMLDWFMEKMPEIELFVDNAFTTIGNVIQWVTDNANWLIPVLTGLAATFVALKVIGAVTYALAILKAIMLAAATAGGILNLVLALNPAILIAIGIGILIAAIVALVMNFDKVKTAAVGLWDKIKEVFGKIRDFVKGVFDGFKNIIKLPKFTVTGSLNPIKWMTEGLPKLNVKWNAEGGIFDSPTIFGTQYGLQGVGEAGAEVVAPLSKLQDMLDWSRLDENALAKAIRKELNGFVVMLNDEKVGEFVNLQVMKGAI
jgi:TP901 family phage tail tape measure protein